MILIQSLPLSSNNANLFFFPQSQISSTYLCPLESFLINSKTVLYIHSSKNPTLAKKTYPTTGQYLTYLTYPNSLVKNRLADRLNENNLMNSFQSAYTKFNSTETTLLAVHDHVIIAMSQQQVTSLCLLDLSAAFDTIDHTILLHRLKSWFGFTDTVLSWIQSYLSSRSFTVDINGIKSPPSKLLYGVPQGSVLGPLLFILYTTPLSSIISQSSVNHKLYADDTQLFLSFSADTFSENILLLQNTISNINFLHGLPQTFYLSILLKLNFFLLDFLHNFLKFTIPHLQFLQIQQYNLFLMLEILVLSLILIFLFLIISHTFRNPASLIFVICDVFVIL